MEKFIKYENLYIAILFFLIISVVFYFLPGNIKNNFGGAMANIVAILTKGSNEEEYAKRFAKCKKEIALIKLADFYDNTSMLIHLDKKHKEQYTYFAEKFYLPLARKLNKSLYEKIKNNIDGVRPKT